jgi:hypothetical protein
MALSFLSMAARASDSDFSPTANHIFDFLLTKGSCHAESRVI